MTRGEIVNARARAGAKVVDARAALDRVRGMRQAAPLVMRLHEQQLAAAERVFAAWGIIESGGWE